MKPYRLALVVLFVVAVTGFVGCHSNVNDTGADVYLTNNSTLIPIYANMASSFPTVSGYTEVVYPTLLLTSHAKNTVITLTQLDDVEISTAVTTCTRSDGGTVASPSWQNSISFIVPHGGSVTFNNYPIFPSEYFQQPPLNQLLCSGCLDKETNNPNIRQKLHVVFYGKTISGQKVSVALDVDVNFSYGL